MNRSRVAAVVSGFPRRSETFILNELLALHASGRLEAILAVKPGDGARPQPGVDRLLPLVHWLPAGTSEHQADAAMAILDHADLTGVHGFFAHAPAYLAALVATRLGVPYGFSTHARDARKVTPAELLERAQRAACVVACNPDVARDIEPVAPRLHLMPHGVDLQRFRPSPRVHAEPLSVLAVGRLVEKKGFEVLLAAMAQVSSPFRLAIVGEGPSAPRLAALAAGLAAGGQVTLCGPATHHDLVSRYSDADVVVVPSVVDGSGDRDGLPNVVLEAMACAKPVIASDAGAIASAVIHGVNGILVPPGDACALAAAIEDLARRPEWAAQLGRNGRTTVERDFALESCTTRLCALFDQVYGC